jgi:hypothetical protein
MIFLVIWLMTNFIFGAGAQTLGFSDAPVAWIAHLGGFFPGSCCFPCSTAPSARRRSPASLRRTRGRATSQSEPSVSTQSGSSPFHGGRSTERKERSVGDAANGSIRHKGDVQPRRSKWRREVLFLSSYYGIAIGGGHHRSESCSPDNDFLKELNLG